MAEELRIPGESTVVVESASQPDESDETTVERKRIEAVLKLARKRFRTADSATEHYRTQAQDDTKFRAGTWGKKTFQWPEGIQKAREDAGRPCLTVNRAPGFVRQVTNHARQAHLRILVSPVDDKGDPKLAEVIQGIVHNIEATSYADRAYTTGSEKQAETGLGFFRLITEWANQKDFRQRIKIKQVRNPLTIYVDPACQEPDFSDAAYAFKVTDLDAAEWKELTGKTEPPTPIALEGFEGNGDQTGDWFPNGKIRYVEYFSRENKGPRKRIAQLSDGHIIDYPDARQMLALKALGDVSIVSTRWVQEKVTMWRKIDALNIHEETVWKADSHPFIPVIGEDLEVDGERDWRGVIRDSKDTGRIYNVEVSALVESVGLGQKAPVVGYRGQFGPENSTMRKAWATANTQPHAFLEVEPMDIDGKAAPIPQRVPMETNITGIVEAIHQADEDYKTTAGFRDASLGERGPQESGKAILARQHQDELGSSHYLDNLRFALCACGRQLIQLIRVVYSVPTVLRIKGNDERQRKVMVFSGPENDPRLDKWLARHPQTGEPVPFQMPDGVTELYDLSVGEFDIEVSAMPSSGSRRQEAVEAMGALFEKMPPELSSKFLDLYFKVLDFPMAAQLAERAKKLLPPGFQDEEEGGQNAISPQEVAMVQQQLEALKQQLMEAADIIKTEKVKTDAQIAIKAMDLDFQRWKVEQESETKIAVAELGAKMERLTLFMEERARLGVQIADEASQARDHMHDDRQTALERQAAQEAAQLGTASEAALAEQEAQHATAAGDRDHQQTLAEGDQAHRQTLTEAEQAHRQTLVEGEQGHKHTLQQTAQAAKLAPKPEADA